MRGIEIETFSQHEAHIPNMIKNLHLLQYKKPSSAQLDHMFLHLAVKEDPALRSGINSKSIEIIVVRGILSIDMGLGCIGTMALPSNRIILDSINLEFRIPTQDSLT
jgi:hypothetical protein